MHTGLLQISASAGSGKTYTLAKRYIMLLIFTTGSDGLLHLRQPTGYHNHILAITFTNKATTEMKRRIIDELYILATNPGKSEFMRDFQKDDAKDHIFAPGTLDNVQQAARQALAAVLYDYGTFNVSTIDSFFQTVMRNFAHELDRDYNYEVQIDSDFALQTAIHGFLLSLGATAGRNSGKLTDVERWVKDYIRQQVSEGYDWNFFKDDGGLLDYAKLMTMEFFREHMPQLHEYLTRDQEGERVPDFSKVNGFKKRVSKLVEQYEQRYLALASRMAQLVNQHGVDCERLYKGRLVENMMKADNPIARGEAYPKSVDELTEEKLVKNSFTKKYEPPQAFVDDVMAWRKEVIWTYNVWQLLAKLPSDLGLLALINSIDENLKQYSRDTNQLLLGDTNDLIARVIESGVPFLYERVGTWINHFMIDEFQDTSRKQYENFKPLLEEALSHNEGENLCMLIGDAKQSIYRFRNAEPSLFRDKIGEDFTPENHGLRQQTLDTNYRSCPAIVEFNNWLFDQLLQLPEWADKDVLQRTYMPNQLKEDFQQQKNKMSPQGMVVARLLAKDKQVKSEEQRQAVLDQLPQYLLQLHERFEWGEIGILVNRRKEGNAIVATIMEYNKTAEPDRQISIASDESMLIARSPSVRRIVSLLRFIDLTQYRMDDEQGEDEESDKKKNAASNRLREQYLYHVLGMFMERMASDEKQEPGLVLEQCFEQAKQRRMLSDREQMDAFADDLDLLLPDRRTELMTLTNIVEHLIRRYINATESAPIETAHLLAFQDCVNDFATQRSGGTVREFLNYWDTRCDKLTVPASASEDAVSVLTIHKAKGLEFDCVLIPFVNWDIKSEGGYGRKIFWLDIKTLKDQNALSVFDDGTPMPEDLIPPLLPLSQSPVGKLAAAGFCLQGFANKYDQDVMVDNVDKTYVAFTRPKQELHLFVQTDSEIGNLLAPILQKGVNDAEASIKQIDDTTYQWGEPRNVDDDKPKKETDEVVMIDMPPYKVTLGAARISVRLPEDLTDKQNTGNRLHNLMSRIAYRRDVERAWGFCLNRGIIRADDIEWPLERVRAVIDRMFDDPRTADWFSDDNRVYNERNLTMGHAATGATKRPDRVIQRPDGTWVVIDYKFGEKNLEQHTSQVAGYMRRLERMGKKPIQGYIWYVALDEIIEVDSL
ncbi:MAG: UvrD-helicase domain-containing protein [Muribaculaceae bacterium]|nr:UvrD-helicase domain-containing protein [Muribaculaceae bacterium]